MELEEILKNPKLCFFYDNHLENGCCTCFECYQQKCPRAVARMTPNEKRFYGVKETENKNNTKEEKAKMKTMKTYQHTNKVVTVPYTGQVVPCLLFVTTELTREGLKLSVNGKDNPFPFKEAVITKTTAVIDDWLLKQGYVEIGRIYVK